MQKIFSEQWARASAWVYTKLSIRIDRKKKTYNFAPKQRQHQQQRAIHFRTWTVAAAAAVTRLHLLAALSLFLSHSRRKYV